MSNLAIFLQKKLLAVLQTMDPSITPCIIEVFPCVNPRFGHYQTNIALKIGKKYSKSPIDFAHSLVERLSLDKTAKITVTPPGFINVTFSNDFLSSRLKKLFCDPKLGVECQEKKRVIVEFSSPNIAKELHVGHLRSTIIGDSIAKLLAFQGHDVCRLNHIGDWGTQFGMLIAYIRTHISEDTMRNTPDLEELMQWYQAAKKQFDEDPFFRKKSQLAVVSLQNKDPACIAVWKQICAISRKAFEEIYTLLDIEIEERGESFYNAQLAPMVKDLYAKKIAVISNGAKCIFVPGFTNRDGEPLPFMIQKSDGGFSYDTTDLAALRHRLEEEKADRVIVVTDVGQSLHFALLSAVAKKAGYYNPDVAQMQHVPFGLVRGEDGKKFKTRSGKIKKLIDLLYKAIDHAKDLVEEKSGYLPEEEKKLLAKVLGIAAVKYADLSSQRQKDYTFSYARMLRFEGNTAIFLLYSYVRMLGIKRKIAVCIEDIIEKTSVCLEHCSEISLALHLLRFTEVIHAVSLDLEPHHLCEYLYKLAEKFNLFFRDCRVEGTSEQNSRLILVECARTVLQKGLYILGIPTIERM